MAKFLDTTKFILLKLHDKLLFSLCNAVKSMANMDKFFLYQLITNRCTDGMKLIPKEASSGSSEHLFSLLSHEPSRETVFLTIVFQKIWIVEITVAITIGGQ